MRLDVVALIASKVFSLPLTSIEKNGVIILPKSEVSGQLRRSESFSSTDSTASMPKNQEEDNGVTFTKAFI